ncbi:transcription termination factor Rho [Zhihengliuella halotolerans]|uniref:Transcription termination factor Rho n=1 Tax=Zhihengliuella halotolerans TaxID=370736 RepID=A0A4Q8ABW3_9MICC|nr:transcription termination factor Rho [Zhihengliuella halotolerans]RZU61677.1 transcription termination factor Rho [Zhihengliuella halotolerans]
MTETTSLEAGVDTKTSAPQNAGLAGLKLAQLQALASQLGITGGSRMRKSDLVEAISKHQRGGSVADRGNEKAAPKKDAATEQPTAAADDAPAEAPKKKRPSRSSAAKQEAVEAPAEAKQDAPAEEAAEAPARTRGRRGSRKATDASVEAKNDGAPAEKPAADKPAEEAPADNESEGRGRNRSRRGGRRNEGAENEGEQAEQKQAEPKQDEQSEQNDGDRQERSGRNRRGRNRRNNQNEDAQNAGDNEPAEKREVANRDDSDGAGRNRRDRDRNRRDRDRERGDRDRDRGRNRNERRRGRGRNQPEVDETELTEDDVLLPVAGILDVLENYAFLRTSGYLPGPNDVYLSLNQVKKHNLRKGDAVVGAIRAPREGENTGGSVRQKFNALVKLTSVNGKTLEENASRVEFNKLVPLYPQERLRLETDPKKVGPRVIDLVAPIGKGQRGLIVSPPKAGKTLILQSIAQAITTNNPEVHLMMVLVDERPEEVTDMQRTVKGEVIASTFDRPADDHTTVAELAIERAKRLVEMGMDVVVLLDSMTRLGRAYNLAAPASGRILSGGVDSAALYPPKRFFGAARNIENGGSLTILATALVETGSKMDEVIFEEFKGTGNMELRLSRKLADKRIFPAVDVNESGTRREENLLSKDEVRIMWRLRRVLSGLDTQQALEVLTSKIRDTQSNAEFLMTVSKTTLGSKSDD